MIQTSAFIQLPWLPSWFSGCYSILMRESVIEAECGWRGEGTEVRAAMSLGFSHVHLPSQMFCWIRIITPLESSRLISGTKQPPPALRTEPWLNKTSLLCTSGHLYLHSCSVSLHFDIINIPQRSFYYLIIWLFLLLSTNDGQIAFPFFCTSPYVGRNCQ